MVVDNKHDFTVYRTLFFALNRVNYLLTIIEAVETDSEDIEWKQHISGHTFENSDIAMWKMLGHKAFLP